ncbi:DMT family transporter [Streptomyces sp. NPDC058770]|uniref:DMT family transporter n=1 Tax=Streptomyces sp. NPDC058770 TaxID=3346631 RepID=UPI0036C4B912
MTRTADHSVGTGAGAGALAVLVASVLWGTTGTAATFAPQVGPLAIGAAAMGLGGLLQAAVAGRSIARFRASLRARWRSVLVGGAGVALYPLAFYTSMRLAGVAVGTVVSIGSAPLASALIERVIDRRRLSRRWMAGAALGVAGTVLLCAAEAAGAGSGSGPGTGSGARTVVGVGLGLLAGATYAVYAWAAHRLITHGVPSRAAMGSVFGLGGLMLVPVLFATGAPLVASWTNAGVGLYMALVPMFTGYVLFGFGLARVPVSTATTLSLLEPAVAAVFAVLVVGERLPVLGWAGIVLVVACLGVLTVPSRRTRPRTPRRAGSGRTAAVPAPSDGAGDMVDRRVTPPARPQPPPAAATAYRTGGPADG